LLEWVHQGFGHESSAIGAKMALGVGQIFCGN
jgi:hypothetical protein